MYSPVGKGRAVHFYYNAPPHKQWYKINDLELNLFKLFLPFKVTRYKKYSFIVLIYQNPTDVMILLEWRILELVINKSLHHLRSLQQHQQHQGVEMPLKRLAWRELGVQLQMTKYVNNLP